MIDSKEFVLSRERVEWLLKPYQSFSEYLEKEQGMNEDRRRFESFTPSNPYVFHYLLKELEWKEGRELLYCEFTKDISELQDLNIALSLKRIAKEDFSKEEKKAFAISDKWKEIDLFDFSIHSLVVRLEESRG